MWELTTIKRSASAGVKHDLTGVHLQHRCLQSSCGTTLVKLQLSYRRFFFSRHFDTYFSLQTVSSSKYKGFHTVTYSQNTALVLWDYRNYSCPLWLFKDGVCVVILFFMWLCDSPEETDDTCEQFKTTYRKHSRMQFVIWSSVVETQVYACFLWCNWHASRKVKLGHFVSFTIIQCMCWNSLPGRQWQMLVF